MSQSFFGLNVFKISIPIPSLIILMIEQIVHKGVG